MMTTKHLVWAMMLRRQARCDDVNQFLKEKKENETWSESLTRASQSPNTKSTGMKGVVESGVGVYDPVGLVTPAKQKGTILVRRAF